MATVKILAFGGSLRRDSFNHRLAEIAAGGARAAGAEVTVIRLADFAMPVFNEDDEKASGAPDGARRLKELLKAHQGLLIASPEYNSGYSGALKNAIDWVSRPAAGEPSLAAFKGKVAGLLAASVGALGGLRGLVQLRMVLGNIGVVVAPEQLAIPKAGDAFDGSILKDVKQRESAEAIGRRVAELTAKIHG
jgi:chromate reductase, NAD(P)H dehydrogenase (quinone)